MSDSGKKYRKSYRHSVRRSSRKTGKQNDVSALAHAAPHAGLPLEDRPDCEKFMMTVI
jgi:hypothetical protein